MNVVRLEDKLVVISAPVGVAVYDFDFDLAFAPAHPHVFRSGEPCVLRVGAVEDYAAQYAEKAQWGLTLVNSPEEFARATDLSLWYPRIADLTPRSEIFDALPDADTVAERFGWPVFLKGARQTAKHSAALSIIEGPERYREAAALYKRSKILHWQKPVLRAFERLARVPGALPGTIPPSLEFRSFWWRGRCVGWGRYWYQVPPYRARDAEDGLALTSPASGR